MSTGRKGVGSQRLPKVTPIEIEMPTQSIAIHKVEDGKITDTIKFTGNRTEVDNKLKGLISTHLTAPKQKRADFCWIISNRDKNKKLGMGLTLVCESPYTDISYQTFWPVRKEKPNLQLNGQS